MDEKVIVQEIPYEKYKEFCEKLPCKDVFYFLKNLFVIFPFSNIIYAIKFNVNKKPQKEFEFLRKRGYLIEYNMSEFLSGLPTNEDNTKIKESLYKDKSILIRM